MNDRIIIRRWTPPAGINFVKFLERENLTVTVSERPPHGYEHLSRFYAMIDNAEAKLGGAPMSISGNGDNPEEAIIALSRDIAGKTLVIDANKASRRQIVVPLEFLP